MWNMYLFSNSVITIDLKYVRFNEFKIRTHFIGYGRYECHHPST